MAEHGRGGANFVNRWLDRLSNWQYGALVAGVIVVSMTVEAIILVLVTGSVNVRFTITFTVLYTVALTSVSVWKRSKGRFPS
jgi:hypothetical protein